MTSPNDRQIGGDHYKVAYQHWDFVRDVGMDYLESQVARYVSRHRKKGGISDLEKALHFVEKMIVERNKALRTLHEFAKVNKMSYKDRSVLSNVIAGDFTKAKQTLNELIIIAEAEEAEEAGPGYVNQDPGLKGPSVG